MLTTAFSFLMSNPRWLIRFVIMAAIAWLAWDYSNRGRQIDALKVQVKSLKHNLAVCQGNNKLLNGALKDLENHGKIREGELEKNCKRLRNIDNAKNDEKALDNLLDDLAKDNPN